jgi:hypothetical protein
LHAGIKIEKTGIDRQLEVSAQNQDQHALDGVKRGHDEIKSIK